MAVAVGRTQGRARRPQSRAATGSEWDLPALRATGTPFTVGTVPPSAALSHRFPVSHLTAQSRFDVFFDGASKIDVREDFLLPQEIDGTRSQSLVIRRFH